MIGASSIFIDKNRLVQLDRAAWGHVLEQHVDMSGHLAETMIAVHAPGHREPDPRARARCECYPAAAIPQASLRRIIVISPLCFQSVHGGSAISVVRLLFVSSDINPTLHRAKFSQRLAAA